MTKRAFAPNAPPTVSLLEVPRPPTGYSFESMLALTYSLDSRVAIALLAAGFGQKPGLEESAPFDLASINPLDMRMFVRRVMAQSLFVVQHSDDPLKGSLSPEMLALLRDRVFTVAVAGDASLGRRAWVNYHPKVILVEFTRGTKRWLRVYLGSKNLSLGAARESGLVFNFPPAGVSHGNSRIVSGRGLLRSMAGFLKETGKNGFGRASDSGGVKRHLEMLSRWGDTLGWVGAHQPDMQAPLGIKDVNLHGQWPGGVPFDRRIGQDLRAARRATVVSPWLDRTGAKFLNENLRRRARADIWVLESERHNLSVLKGRGARLVMDASSNIYAEGVEKEGAEIGFNLRHHAKVYAFDHGAGGVLWLGSANWTRPGLGLERCLKPNFEILVRLVTRGPATQWFSGLQLQSLDRILNDNSETPERIDEDIAPLGWIRADWQNYPKLLRLSIVIPHSARAEMKSFCRTISVSVLDDLGDELPLGTVAWAALRGEGFAVIRGALPSKDIRFQSIVILRARGGAGEGSIASLHAPVPDEVASRRLEHYQSIKVKFEDVLERLILLQEGLGGSSSPGRSTGHSAKDADYYLSHLRLERLFLRMIADADEGIPEQVEEALKCLRESKAANSHRELLASIEYVCRSAQICIGSKRRHA